MPRPTEYDNLIKTRALDNLKLFLPTKWSALAQSDELTLDGDAPRVDPLFGLGQDRRVERAGAHPADLLASHQPGGLQHGDMLAHGGQAHRQRFGQLADRGRSGRQPLEDAAAGGIGERLEHGVEGLGGA